MRTGFGIGVASIAACVATFGVASAGDSRCEPPRGWHVAVDLDKQSTCIEGQIEVHATGLDALQSGFNEFNDPVRRGSRREVRIWVQGETSFTTTDMHRVRWWDYDAREIRDTGPFLVAVELRPGGGKVCEGTRTFCKGSKPSMWEKYCEPGIACAEVPAISSDGYPVASLGKADPGGVWVHWDMVRLSFDPDADDSGTCDQAVPSVGFLRGGKYTAGNTAGSFKVFTETGHRIIEVLDDGNTDPPWPEGVPVPMDQEHLFASRCTFVAEWTFGVTDPIVDKLSAEFIGHPSDTDDIAIGQVDSWGHHRTGHKIKSFARSMQLYGNIVSTLSKSQLPFNGRGNHIVLGDWKNSGAVVKWKDCLDGACDTQDAMVKGVYVRDSLVEGAKYGPLVAYSINDLYIDGSHFEHSYRESHGLLIGAGACDGAGGKPLGFPCGNDIDCGEGGVCTCPGLLDRAQVRTARIIATGISSSQSEVWSPLMFGACGGTGHNSGPVLFSGSLGRNPKGGENPLFWHHPRSRISISFEGSRKGSLRYTMPNSYLGRISDEHGQPWEPAGE